MAVQSLKSQSTPLDAPADRSHRGRLNNDQEKLLEHERVVTTESRSQNVSPSQKTALPRWRHKGREKSSIELACTWIVDHQIGISVHILSLLFITHICFPQAQHHTQKFFSISYYNPRTDKYALGWDDIFFVFFWIVVFSGARCAIMDYLLRPLAVRAGVRKKKAGIRFAEQAWLLLYSGSFWSCGMYIMITSPYFLSLKALWTDFPSREMVGLTKWYYLVQFAFWLQQIVVVNIEERRKDYAQMFTHHIITCALIFTSYGYHQAAVGNVILCLMDVVDLFLPLAKIFKYMKWNTICDVTFGVFMVTWFIARHVLYGMVCWSVYAHVPSVMNYGCYRGASDNLKGPLPVPNDWDHLIQPFYDPEGLICMNDNIRGAFLSLLLALQVVLIIWFVMIIRVAYKVIKGHGADDTRSDDEDDEEQEEEEDTDIKLKHPMEEVPEPTAQFIEQEVTTDSPHYVSSSFSSSKSKAKGKGKASPSSSLRRTRSSNNHGNRISSGDSSSSNGTVGAATTSVSLGRAGDRKELLGRIGCDKGS